MSNTMEAFCNHCKKETLFFLESDFVWYCGECENPLDSEPLIEDDEELEEALEEFEEYYGDAVYCRTCGNFVRIPDILEDEICPFCMDELGMELEKKGYEYDEELGKYVKENKE